MLHNTEFRESMLQYEVQRVRATQQRFHRIHAGIQSSENSCCNAELRESVHAAICSSNQVQNFLNPCCIVKYSEYSKFCNTDF